MGKFIRSTGAALFYAGIVTVIVVLSIAIAVTVAWLVAFLMAA